MWGDHMLALAVAVRDFALPSSHEFFVENGTLLGALRDGRLIPHDDDFDFGVVISSMSEIDDIHEYISAHLPEPYRVRRVSSYADKLEIFDPTHGSHVLIGDHYEGADFHYVTVDVQFHLRDGHMCRCLYRQPGHLWEFPLAMVHPLSQVVVEGEAFPAPGFARRLLKLRYGCLDRDAVYDPLTGFYVPRSDEKTGTSC